MIEMLTAPILEGNHLTGIETKIAPVEFSFFSRPVTNTIPNRGMTVWEAYNDIRSNRYQPQTAVLRAISDKNIARNYKARNLDYVTFSGLFTKRSDAGLIKHSGLMTLDFDHVSELKELKATLLCDDCLDTVLLFTSPSGDGVKWIVSIDINEHSHWHWFKAIANYLKATYHLEVDGSGKDVSRCCFLPYDPEVFINPKYIL